MSNIKVIDIRWANNSMGSVGMVLADNGFGVKHIYIGTVKGFDEETDIKQILDWGTKFKADSFASFLNQ